MIVAFTKNELKDGTKRNLSEYSNDLETRVKNEFDKAGKFTGLNTPPNNDLNSIQSPGIYYIGSGVLNTPGDYGYILHLSNSNVISTQLFFSGLLGVSTRVGFRSYTTAGGWSSWSKIL